MRKKGIEKPRLEAQILLGHLLNLSKILLYTKDDKPLTAKEVDDFRELLVKKGKNMPTAYITNQKEFFGENFYIDEDVLIPRPETEELIEWLLDSFDTSNFNQDLKVLDLCCGSGCIGTILHKQMKLNSISFSDLSETALSVTQKNVQKFGIEEKATMILSDLFTQVTDSFDLIVSNPPYIPEDEYRTLDCNVRDFEPQLALLVDNANTFFKSLFTSAKEKLNKGGWLYLETNPSLIQEQFELMKSVGYKQVEIKNDLSNKERFLRGKNE